MQFLKSNRRFDFLYGGKKMEECEYKVTAAEENGSLTTVYSFADGLTITNIAKKYEKYGAYEWVNWLENTGEEPTEIISELWDASCSLPIGLAEPYRYQAYQPDMDTQTKIYAPTGSTWESKEFYVDADELSENVRTNHIYPGRVKEYQASGGRSSEKRAPFFNIHYKGGGVIAAIGWTGQWKCRLSRSENDITIQTKIEDTNFRLLPGEKIRTSSIVIMPYIGSVVDSQNQWRRLVKEEFSLIGKPGRGEYGPFCAGIWGGMRTQSVLERIQVMKENQLPFEYVWMDAGWYGADTMPTPDEFEGDWARHTGDWRISKKTHPNALKDVSRAIHEAGMKFLLWVEPERAIYKTPIVSAHPDYFLGRDSAGDWNRLLNLGNPEAWNYCFELLSGLIGDLEVDCYRQDFNMAPLEYWRKNDAGDRKGITEIKHITGLYRLWDALLERFPNLIIDNCASGGRRIDIETLRRSIPLWRSDLMCSANYDCQRVQCHQINFSSWLPYSGTAAKLYDPYRFRTAYSGAMVAYHSYRERENFGGSLEELEMLKKYSEEYLLLRPYYSEDFYPLTEASDRLDIWCGVQFDRPEKKDGIVQVFKREKSPYERAAFALGGIDRNAEYTFTDLDDGTHIVMSGRELIEKGFVVLIPEKRCAKVWQYVRN